MNTSSCKALLTYHQLLAKKAKLEDELERSRLTEAKEVVVNSRKQMKEYGITVADLIGGKGPSGLPKYRDPDTGSTWSGRGRRPLWLERGREETYLVR